MPLNRLYLEMLSNEQAEYDSALEQLQVELSEAIEEVKLWENAQPFIERLKQMESSALELMISGPPEDMASIRERIKVIRSLLDEPVRVEHRRQELERALEDALTGVD